MLDALVAKLPGVTLTRNGQIAVDGHPVKELLVNGRDFLDGNPLTLLRNLPAYTVNKIKVYNKAGAASRLMNKDMGDKATVMDVRLKREYATMYLFNNEAGVGSDKRYLGRMFEVKHSDKGEFGLIANANNLNREDLDMNNDNWDYEACRGTYGHKDGGAGLQPIPQQSQFIHWWSSIGDPQQLRQ